MSLKTIFNRPLPFLYFVIVIVVVGIFRFNEMPVGLYPNVSKPSFTIGSWKGSYDKQAFYEDYGKILEEKLIGHSEIESVNSRYSNESRRWEVKFKWNVDLDEAEKIISQEVASFKSLLPKSMDGIWFGNSESRSGRILLALESDSVTAEELYKYGISSVLPKIRGLASVDVAWMNRAKDFSLSIKLSYEKMLSYGIKYDQVYSLLDEIKESRSLGVRTDKNLGQTYSYIFTSKFRDVESIASKVIVSREDQDVTLGDIAQVGFVEDAPNNIAKVNGKRSLMIQARPKLDANISAFCQEVLEIVEQEFSVFSGVNIIQMTNPSKFIDSAIQNIIVSLALGILIATFVVFLFFKSVGSTLIISTSIPISLAGGVCLMSLIGVQLNLISLGAMALAVGMVVDGSVVVYENIMRHLENRKIHSMAEFASVCIESSKEVLSPVVASIATTIIVFTPLLFTAPIAKAILGDLASVITLVLFTSIFVSCLYVPIITYLVYRKRADQMKLDSSAFTRFFEKVKTFYLNSLSWLIERKSRLTAAFCMMFIFLGCGVYVISKVLPKEVVPTPKTDKLVLQLQNKTSEKDLLSINKKAKVFEQKIASDYADYVSSYQTFIGDWGAQVLLNLKSAKIVDEVKSKMNRDFKTNLDFKVFVWEWTPTNLEIPNPPALYMYFDKSIDQEEMNDITKILEDTLKELKDIRVNNATYAQKEQVRELKLKDKVDLLDPKLKSRLRNEIPRLIQLFNTEKEVKQVEYEGINVPVKLGFSDVKREGFSFENVVIPIEEKFVPIRNYVDFVTTSIYNWIYYKNNKRQLRIEINHEDKIEFDDLKSKIVSAIPNYASKVTFVDGQVEIEENLNSLVLAFIIAVAGVLFIILTQFSSFKDALVILTSIPLGFFGVAMALWVFDQTLSMNSLLGIILLAGIAVNNSIIFTDFFKSRLRELANNVQNKIDINGLILETARVRFRPIVVTTLTTMIGMVPIAVGMGEGGDVLRSLGLAIVFGLGWSTVSTLFIIPAMLKILYRRESDRVASQ